MSINIQLENGLQKLSGQSVTKSKIISSLGYTPAKNTDVDVINTTIDAHKKDTSVHFNGNYNDLKNKPNITEDGSGEVTIADKSGNVIFRVDAQGAHTTKLELSSGDIDRQIDALETSLATHKEDTSLHFSGDYNDLENKPNIVEDGSGEVSITDNDGNIIFKVDAQGAHTTKLSLSSGDVDRQIDALETSLNDHKENDFHFSGDYNDLENKPNITEDGSGEVVIADNSGNVILKVDSTGLETTDIKAKSVVVEGTNVTTKFSEHETLISNKVNTADIVDNLTSIDTNKPLSANQGKVLKDLVDAKVNTADIIDNLSSTDTNKPLSANQGNVLKTSIDEVDTALDNHRENDFHFSGDYNDLSNKPNITEDNSGDVVIADNSGNVILRVDNSGLETTNVKAKTVVVDGTDVTTKFSEQATFIEDLKRRLNALADSDDTTLDQLSEIVAYIKSNKSLIDSITTSKVNVSDIIDNLTSTDTNKPLSANQGKVLRTLLDGLSTALDTHSTDGSIHITPTERTNWDNHIANKNNPHSVTKAQVGLGNVDNTSDANKPVSTAQQTALDALKAELSETIVSESKEWVIVDNSGNVILRVDNSGLETTDIKAKTSITVNGTDVKVALDSKVNVTDIVNNLTSTDTNKPLSAKQGNVLKDLLSTHGSDTSTHSDIRTTITTHTSNGDIHVTKADKTAWNAKADQTALTTHTGNTTVHITEAERTKWNKNITDLSTHTSNGDIHVTKADKTAWNAKADQTALTTHTGNTTVHITANERNTWNSKSDFSGNYNDLDNAPNITEDNSETYNIVDKSGNIIMTVNKDGINTTNVSLKGVPIYNYIVDIDYSLLSFDTTAIVS